MPSALLLDFSLPDRRTVRARVAGDPGSDEDPAPIPETAGVKATTPTPGKLVATRPLEIVQIDHTEVDVVGGRRRKQTTAAGAAMADPGH